MPLFQRITESVYSIVKKFCCSFHIVFALPVSINFPFFRLRGGSVLMVATNKEIAFMSQRRKKVYTENRINNNDSDKLYRLH